MSSDSKWPLTLQWLSWGWFRWGFRRSLRSTIRTPPWDPWSRQIKVSPPSRFVISSPSCWFGVKLDSSWTLIVFKKPVWFVVVCSSARAVVVVWSAWIVSPLVWIWWTTCFSGFSAMLRRVTTSRCVSGCAVCLYELYLKIMINPNYLKVYIV